MKAKQKASTSGESKR